MKTLTEFFGPDLIHAHRIREAVIADYRKPKPAAPEAEPQAEAEVSQAPPDVLPTEPPSEVEPVEAFVPEVETQAEAEVSQAPPAVSGDGIPKPVDIQERIATADKRAAEDRKRRHEERRALLEAVREPFLAKLKEKYKWSDERFSTLSAALEILDAKRLSDLRRVVVWKPEKEGEAVPNGGRMVDGLVYFVEYRIKAQKPGREDDDKGRREGRGGKGGRRGPKGEMKGRRTGGPRSESRPEGRGFGMPDAQRGRPKGDFQGRPDRPGSPPQGPRPGGSGPRRRPQGKVPVVIKRQI